MSRGRLLVVTTVHQPDDARIRSKLIGTLVGDWQVTYATRLPGPTDRSDLTWRSLPGNRTTRWVVAARLMLEKRWDLVAFHDPDLLPAGLLRSWLGRPTLFDLHENLPAQIGTKDWLPPFLRPLLRGLSRLLLRLAELTMTVTLAEEGYQRLFGRRHEVIPNHPLVSALPPPAPCLDPAFLAYVGDVTEQRGAFLAIEAAAGAGHGLVMIGRIAPPQLADRLLSHAAAAGVDLRLVGPLPHGEALAAIAGAAAGLSPLLDIPNYRHSLPTKLLEYLAMGLPVLASDLPGSRTVVEAYHGVVFVAAGDPEAWRQAGSELADDPARRIAAQAAVGAVRRAFGWPADLVLRVYAEAARR